MYIWLFLVLDTFRVELDILFHAPCFSMFQCVYKVTEFINGLHTQDKYNLKLNLNLKLIVFNQPTQIQPF